MLWGLVDSEMGIRDSPSPGMTLVHLIVNLSPERVVERHQRWGSRGGEYERRDLHLLLGLLALRGLEPLAVSILHDGKLPDTVSYTPLTLPTKQIV